MSVLLFILTLSGTDYSSVTTTLTFPAGVTSTTFTVATLDDVINENQESFTAVLSSPMNAMLGSADTATISITDDDRKPLLFYSMILQSVIVGEILSCSYK